MDFEQFMQAGFDSVYAMAVYAENQDMFRICYHNYDASVTYEDNSRLKQELLWEIKQNGPYEWHEFQAGSKELLISTCLLYTSGFHAFPVFTIIGLSIGIKIPGIHLPGNMEI